MKPQRTLDDLEPVITNPVEMVSNTGNVGKVKGRSREALEMYDRIQEQKAVDDDPLFD
jgi:hypothetical protein